MFKAPAAAQLPAMPSESILSCQETVQNEPPSLPFTSSGWWCWCRGKKLQPQVVSKNVFILAFFFQFQVQLFFPSSRDAESLAKKEWSQTNISKFVRGGEGKRYATEDASSACSQKQVTHLIMIITMSPWIYNAFFKMPNMLYVRAIIHSHWNHTLVLVSCV